MQRAAIGPWRGFGSGGGTEEKKPWQCTCPEKEDGVAINKDQTRINFTLTSPQSRLSARSIRMKPWEINNNYPVAGEGEMEVDDSDEESEEEEEKEEDGWLGERRRRRYDSVLSSGDHEGALSSGRLKFMP